MPRKGEDRNIYPDDTINAPFEGGEVILHSPEELAEVLKEKMDQQELIRYLIGDDYNKVNDLSQLALLTRKIFNGPIGRSLFRFIEIRDISLIDGANKIEIVNRALINHPDKIPVAEIESITKDSQLREKVWKIVLGRFGEHLTPAKQRVLRENRCVFRYAFKNGRPFENLDCGRIADSIAVAKVKLRDRGVDWSVVEDDDWIETSRYKAVACAYNTAHDFPFDLSTVTADSGLRSRLGILKAELAERQSSPEQKKRAKFESEKMAAEKKLLFSCVFHSPYPFKESNFFDMIKMLEAYSGFMIGQESFFQVANRVRVVLDYFKSGQPIDESLILNIPTDSGLQDRIRDLCGKRIKKFRVDPNEDSAVLFPSEGDEQILRRLDEEETTPRLEKDSRWTIEPIRNIKSPIGYKRGDQIAMRVEDLTADGAGEEFFLLLQEAKNFSEVVVGLEKMSRGYRLAMPTTEIGLSEGRVYRLKDVLEMFRGLENGSVTEVQLQDQKLQKEIERLLKTQNAGPIKKMLIKLFS